MGVRYAPSPTGTLHLGNLRTAWISHALARAHGMPWVVRFEDIDRPRVVPGAQRAQLEDLRALSLVPDQITVQSAFEPLHWAAFERAVEEGVVYPCFCSRKEVRAALEGIASAPHLALATQEALAYSGRCRALTEAPAHSLPTLAWRFRASDPTGARDFIIARSSPELGPGRRPARASFAPAYHWACALDDLEGRYRLLVRAHDLCHALEPQREIQRWFGRGAIALPAVFHASLVTRNDGHRLEKRTQGVTLRELLAQGLDPRAITERFERSFDSSLLRAPVAPEGEFGEKNASITLEEAGF